MNEELQQDSQTDRLSSLNIEEKRTRHHNKSYSKIIKSLQIALPLIAGALIFILLSWQRVDTIPNETTINDNEQSIRTVGKNELLTPRFESEDDKGNPYTITAQRALQGQSSDDDMILLESPVADIALESGNWLAVKASQSAYRQESQRLFMKGNVEMFHDEGYTLSTEEMDVDMKAGTARTDLDVHVQGPKGQIDAKGLEADRPQGLLIFKGPAKLILNEGL